MKRFLLALPILLGACSMSPSADVLKALASDPNAICVTITTPWGGSTLDRNHGCGAATTPVVLVTSGGPTPLHVEELRPQ